MNIKVTIEVIEELVNSETIDLDSSLAKEILSLVKERFISDKRVSSIELKTGKISFDKRVVILDDIIVITGIVEVFTELGESNGSYIYPFEINRETGLLSSN